MTLFMSVVHVCINSVISILNLKTNSKKTFFGGQGGGKGRVTKENMLKVQEHFLLV